MDFSIDTSGADRPKHLSNVRANYLRASEDSLRECLSNSKKEKRKATTDKERYIASVHIEVLNNLIGN